MEFESNKRLTKGVQYCCGPFESKSLKFIALLKVICLVFKVYFPPLNFKVEGDTVTFSFEMRSGREHNTPDKAMWGFACTVRAQVLESNHCCGHNVLSPVCLGYIHHICPGNRAEYEPWFHPLFHLALVDSHK